MYYCAAILLQDVAVLTSTSLITDYLFLDFQAGKAFSSLMQSFVFRLLFLDLVLDFVASGYEGFLLLLFGT